jgi:hypothetical protein
MLMPSPDEPDKKQALKGGIVTAIAVLAGLATITGLSIKEIVGRDKQGSANVSPTTITGTPNLSSTTRPPTTSVAPPTKTSNGPQPNYHLELRPDTYADLDHGAVNDAGGRKYELHLDFTGTRLFHLFEDSQENTWPSRYKLIKKGT